MPVASRAQFQPSHHYQPVKTTTCCSLFEQKKNKANKQKQTPRNARQHRKKKEMCNAMWTKQSKKIPSTKKELPPSKFSSSSWRHSETDPSFHSSITKKFVSVYTGQTEQEGIYGFGFVSCFMVRFFAFGLCTVCNGVAPACKHCKRVGNNF